MSRGDFRQDFTGLESIDERALLLRAPRAAHVLGKLGATRSTRSTLLQRRNSSEQSAQHVRMLQNRAGRKLLPVEWIDALDEGLKNLSCALLLHE